ncbi:MAG: PDZ domain-containing protein [Chthonomonas sp.]|nr:PDZ domain-containing protein [Chthonomonas sp.]
MSKSTTPKWLPYAAVALCIGGFLGGTAWRGRVDDVPKVPASGILAPPEQLLASNDRKPPATKIAADDYFLSLVAKIDELYVEEVKNHQDLAIGGAKGMVASLGDPLAIFMTKSQFEAYQSARHGRFSGVGLELEFKWQAKRPTDSQREADVYSDIPELVVTSVVPGSAAEKAGLAIGDKIDSLDGRWLLSTARIKYFRETSATLRKTRPWTSDAEKKLKLLDEQIKKGTTLTKVRDILMANGEKPLDLTIQRAGATKTVKLMAKGVTAPPVSLQDGKPAQLRFFLGAADELARLSTKEPLELDLRNSTMGDFDAMKDCLSLFGGQTTWGNIVDERQRTPRPLTTNGEDKFGPVKLLVDNTTVGMAVIFAQALVAAGKAELVGTLPAKSPTVLTTQTLPDGSGFTLPIGTFQPAKVSK